MTPQGPIGRRAAGGLQGLAVASQRILERALGFRTASQRADGLSRADQAAGRHTRIAQFERLAERLLTSV